MRRTTEEYSGVIRGQTVYVPWLDEETIATRAKRLLERCGVNCSLDSIPVPIETILEERLEFHLSLDDVGDDILGSTLWATRTVRVNEKLDPSVHPEQLGEYRFTIAHEIGHIQLHHGY